DPLDHRPYRRAALLRRARPGRNRPHPGRQPGHRPAAMALRQGLARPEAGRSAVSTVRTDDWRRAAVLFERALDQPPELRGEFLRRVCGADCELQATVESLLVLDEEAEEGGCEVDPLDDGLPLQPDPP